MRRFSRWAAMTLVSLTLSCQWGGTQYPDAPGTIFIRQQICDIDFFKSHFLLNPKMDLKEKGFTAYSLHRDLADPKTYLVILRCNDLKRGVEFVQSSNFHAVCVGAGLGTPLFWAGEDGNVRNYRNLPSMSGGIIIARATTTGDLRGSFDQEKQTSGTPRAGRDSLYYLLGQSEAIIAVEEVSDPTQVPGFLSSGSFEGIPLTHWTTWRGINLEEGLFR